jgi:hypothetical protein
MPHPEPERREHAPPGTTLLAGLTPEQAQAVTRGSGPLLLIAGPGAGAVTAIFSATAPCPRNQAPHMAHLPQPSHRAQGVGPLLGRPRPRARWPAELELPGRRGTTHGQHRTQHDRGVDRKRITEITTNALYAA